MTSSTTIVPAALIFQLAGATSAGHQDGVRAALHEALSIDGVTPLKLAYGTVLLDRALANGYLGGYPAYHIVDRHTGLFVPLERVTPIQRAVIEFCNAISNVDAGAGDADAAARIYDEALEAVPLGERAAWQFLFQQHLSLFLWGHLTEDHLVLQ